MKIFSRHISLWLKLFNVTQNLVQQLEVGATFLKPTRIIGLERKTRYCGINIEHQIYELVIEAIEIRGYCYSNLSNFVTIDLMQLYILEIGRLAAISVHMLAFEGRR